MTGYQLLEDAHINCCVETSTTTANSIDQSSTFTEPDEGFADFRQMAVHGVDDEIVIDAADINHEASSNLWCFSPCDDEFQGLSAAALVDFINQVMTARREKLSGNSSMLFYCWHDAQTRQLRFSLVSSTHGRLPFGCAIDPSTELAAIAEQSSGRTGSMPTGARLGRTALVQKQP